MNRRFWTTDTFVVDCEPGAQAQGARTLPVIPGVVGGVRQGRAPQSIPIREGSGVVVRNLLYD